MNLPRLHVPGPLQSGATLGLPPTAARHAQVLRLQPGSGVILFDGRGGQWRAEVLSMGRSEVMVAVQAHEPLEHELPRAITLAVVMPANDRMDDLVEKATELGVAAIQPLVSERSVLRLSGERAAKRVAHWQAVAIAACEQCGRNRVPAIAPVLPLMAWLSALNAPAPSAAAASRWLLSPRVGATGLAARLADGRAVLCLSGPEGGLSDAEEDAAESAGFRPVSLGPRILRADTAPLAVLAALALTDGPPFPSEGPA